MTNILITSPDFIRLNSNISDNLNSKVLATAIREVQENELQEVIGQVMLEKIKELIASNEIENEGNEWYKLLVEKSQFFVTYRVIAELTVMTSLKIDNAGVVQSRDEYLDNVNMDDTMTLKKYYDTKADHYCYMLQNFILENLAHYPEITESQCHKIRATLYSAANPSVFLGGRRGRGLWRMWPYRCQPGINWP